MQSDPPVIRSVFHPTDYSEESDHAFAHALASAVVAGARLTIMGIDERGDGPDFSDFPKVRDTLSRWKLLPKNAPRDAVEREVGIKVKKISVGTSRPVKAATDFVIENQEDLVVIACHQGDAPGWLRGSASERLAERSQAMTLFVPSGGRGFVSPETGTLTLRRVLVPVAPTPDASSAIARAARVAERIGEPEGEATILHVGDPGDAPSIVHPPDHPWSWTNLCVQGDVIDEIVAAAERIDADLIIMATDGKDGLLDIFRGSHSQRVVRRAPCPLLAIPV